MDIDDMSASDARPCEIETALIENQNHVYEIFRYEAARDEMGCRTVAGRLPWYWIKQEDARQACEQIGWRLCL